MKVVRKFVFFPLFVMLHCHVAYAQRVEHVKTFSFEGYVFPSNHLIAGLFPITNGCDLDMSQISKAEKILRTHISDIKKMCPNILINKCELKKYKRQYWGNINQEGHIVINILLIHNRLAKEINTEEDIASICDGGCDVINVMIDIEDAQIIIKPNGVAMIPLEDNAISNDSERNVTFYHGDHLWSANWITDGDGRIFPRIFANDRFFL